MFSVISLLLYSESMENGQCPGHANLHISGLAHQLYECGQQQTMNRILDVSNHKIQRRFAEAPGS